MKTIEEIAREAARGIVNLPRHAGYYVSEEEMTALIAAAIRKGAGPLVEALNYWHCPECGGHGHLRFGRTCGLCNGDQLHRTARDALALFSEPDPDSPTPERKETQCRQS